MRGRDAVLRTAAFLCLTTGSLTPIGSTTLLPINLPGLVEEADRAFLGRVIAEWTGRDENGLPATITTFKVMEVLKGGVGEEIQVKQLGVTEVQPDGLATWVDGMPRYPLGADFLLFLPPDSPLGFTSPLGLLQGAFLVRPDAAGVPVAVNGVDNANLFLDVGSRDLTRLGLDAFPSAARDRGPIPLDEILGMVRKIRQIAAGDPE